MKLFLNGVLLNILTAASMATATPLWARAGFIEHELPGPGPRRSRFTGIAAMRRKARKERNRRNAA